MATPYSVVTRVQCIGNALGRCGLGAGEPKANESRRRSEVWWMIRPLVALFIWGYEANFTMYNMYGVPVCATKSLVTKAAFFNCNNLAVLTICPHEGGPRDASQGVFEGAKGRQPVVNQGNHKGTPKMSIQLSAHNTPRAHTTIFRFWA